MKTNNALSFVPGPRGDAQDMPGESPLTPGKARRWCEHQSMKMIARILLTVLALALWIASPAAEASPLLYSQGFDGQSGFGPSDVWAPFECRQGDLGRFRCGG